MRRISVVLFLTLFAAGCVEGGPHAARTVKYPNAVTPQAQADFNAASALYRSKKFADADAALARLVETYPYNELTDESRFLRGEIAFAKGDYAGAIARYREAVSEIESPKVAPKARFKTALALSKLSRPKEAQDELAKIGRRDASAVLRMRIDSLGAKTAKAAGIAPNAAVIWSLWLLDDYAEAQGVVPTGIPAGELVPEQEAEADARRWIGDLSVTAAEVEALPTKEMRGRRSGGYASYKMALVLHGTGDTAGASRALKSFISTYPKHEYYASARILMTELGGEVGDVAGTKIGVIVPLSGKYSVYGESVLHGVECAAGVFEPCVGPAGASIIVRDSESEAGGAVRGVEELAAEGVVAIIGPLLSAGAVEAAARAQELGVPMISVSQRDGTAEAGDFVFRNSVSDSSEISTLADHAVNRLKLRRFFVIYPPSKKGSEYRALFTEAVRALGGTVVGSQSFSPSRAGGVVDELRGRYLAEQQMAMAEDGAAGEPMIDLSATGEFDALFVPDSVGVASYVTQRMSLSASGSARTFTLLGISRWDDQGLVSRAGVKSGYFVDSFYKNSQEEPVAGFVSRFTRAYGVAPTMLEALGYDSMRILLSAVQEKGAVRRDSIREALARTQGFPGVTGKTSFDSQGNASKEMWVLRIRDGRIEPAK